MQEKQSKNKLSFKSTDQSADDSLLINSFSVLLQTTLSLEAIPHIYYTITVKIFSKHGI